MKKINKLILLGLFLYVSIGASAYDFSAKNADGVTIYYDITSDTDLTCEVTYRDYTQHSSYSGEVKIPASVTYNGKTYSVICIGAWSFNRCEGLISVAIPNSVISIDDNAFYNCSYLTSIEIPNSVTNIRHGAFEGCRNVRTIIWDSAINPNCVTQYCKENLKEVTIGNSVTSISESVFSGCSCLTSITIGNSVTSIENRAFEGCCGLKSVNITDLDKWAEIEFGGSSANPLTDAHNLYLNGKIVTDAELISATKIGSYAFNGCSGLTSIYILNSVTSIGKSAFSGCTGLTSVTIPNSVISIGNEAFEGCSNLRAIVWNSTVNPNCVIKYCKKNLKEVTIGNSVTSIGSSAFEGCSGLTSITIGNSVTSIGERAFYKCSGLTSITIGNSLTSIGERAFYECTGLTSVTIPNSVTSIGNYAFEHCSGLTSITIGNSVTSIGEVAFGGCGGLTSIEIPNSVTSIGDRVFEGCSGLTSVIIPNSVTSIGYRAFYGCTGLTSVIIPNSVTSVRYWTFYECSGLTSVTIPNSVTSVDNSAFEGCSNIRTIIWDSAVNPNRVTQYCKENLKEVTIGNSVTSIGESVFSGCSGLTSVTIGNSVTNIGSNAFDGCSGLTAVNITDLDKWAEMDFYNYSANPLYYAQNLYLNGKLVTDAKLTSATEINGYAFNNCSSLASIEIPNSVTSIGNRAFDGCSGLTAVNITDLDKWAEIAFCNYSANPLYYAKKLYLNGGLVTDARLTSATYIGAYAFYGCSSLTSIEIPNSVTSIGGWAFEGCSGLKSMTIGNSVTRIGERAFLGCSGLKSINIPNAMEEIGQYAFSGCTSLPVENNLRYADTYLVEVVDKTTLSAYSIRNGTRFIGERAFQDCVGLTSVTIPISVISIGDYAFSRCSSLEDVFVCRGRPYTISDNVFDTNDKGGLILITLHVPIGKTMVFQLADVWCKFYNIQEWDPSTGIEKVEASPASTEFSTGKGKNLYNLQGVKVNSVKKGEVYIRDGRKFIAK